MTVRYATADGTAAAGSDAAFVFRAIDRVCDPAIIALQHRMVSISQVFSVDLTGQACSDQFEGELYGGVSAQPDLLRATLDRLGPVDRVVLVGDTVYDVESARRAGMPCLTVRTGGFGEEEVGAAGAALVTRSAEDLCHGVWARHLAAPSR